MNIFSHMLGAITGMVESAKSTISGFFGYDEASEEIAQNIAPDEIADAELDNLQETVTSFYEEVYNEAQGEIESNTQDFMEPAPEPAPEPEPAPAPYFYDEHPIDETTGFYAETVTTDEPMPAYQPDEAEPDFLPDESGDTSWEEPPDMPPISPETWGEWEQPKDEYNPDEATSDQYNDRVNVARDYGIPEMALTTLSDEELSVFTSITGNVHPDSELNDPESYLKEFYPDNEDATIRESSTDIKRLLEYMGDKWQFYSIDIFYSWETDEYYYTVIHMGDTNNKK